MPPKAFFQSETFFKADTRAAKEVWTLFKDVIKGTFNLSDVTSKKYHGRF